MEEYDEIEEAIKNLSEIVELSEDDTKNNNKNATAILDLEDIESLKTLLQEFNKLEQDNYRLDRENQKLFEENINSISKEKIEEYLAEETEKYKVYKKEVDKNENLRGQLWHHMGAKNMCEKILGIEKKVTLD